MVADKYTNVKIKLNQEERDILRRATIILRQINGIVEESDDADEACLSDVVDKKIISDIADEIDNLNCTIDF